MRTTHLLCEHTEKIVAAIALRKAHNQLVLYHSVCIYIYTARARWCDIFTIVIGEPTSPPIARHLNVEFFHYV